MDKKREMSRMLMILAFLFSISGSFVFLFSSSAMAQTGAISGQVTEGSVGISGVYVYVYDSNYSYLGGETTDSLGDYIVTGLPSGDHKVEFWAYGTGYVSEWYNNKADFDSADLVTVIAPGTTTDIDAILELGGSISGRVTDGSTGINNIHVQAIYSNTNRNLGDSFTNASGYYTASGLPTGNYKVLFDTLGTSYASEWYNDKPNIDRADTVMVTAPGTTTGIDAVLELGGSISGRVTDGSTGIAGVDVIVYDSDYHTIDDTGTDANGNYTLNRLPSGNHKVEFLANNTGYYSEWYNDRSDFYTADEVIITAPDTITGIDAVLRSIGSEGIWSQVKKIIAGDGSADDWFGVSVSISGDTVAVGAFFDDDNGAESGSAYIYSRDQGGFDNWGQVQKIIASDGTIDDRFGRSVSISGDTIVAGAFRDDDNGADSGSAYIFSRDQGGLNNWGQVAKITASDGAAGDYFGFCVSISGDIVVVGASGGTGPGSAYIFSRDQGGLNNWGQVTKITASDGAAGDYFGYSVSISGHNMVAGARSDDDNGADSGSAYIFSRDWGGVNNWGQRQKITASDGAAGDYFGDSVSISYSNSRYTVAVGAPRDDDNGSESGSAYIFYEHQGGLYNWGQVQKVLAGDGVASDNFGDTVSIGYEKVVVGSYDEDSYGAGSAYIYSRYRGGTDNWGQVQKIAASDGTAYDYFGNSASISGDTVVVGARLDDDNDSQSGSAYIFMNTMPEGCVVEDFSDPLSDWLSGWFYANTNAENLYVARPGYSCDPDYRGNQPDGIWISDDRGCDTEVQQSPVRIDFFNGHGNNATSFSMDHFTCVTSVTINVYDKDGVLVASDPVASNCWNWTNYSVPLTNGISAFEYAYTGSHVEGNTSIDNVELCFGESAYGDELAVDFGASGLWHYDGSWIRISSWNPDGDLAGWSNGLAVDFGSGRGLWNRDGSSWSRISNWDADSAGLSGWSGGLAVDFNGSGLWNNDGSSWSRLSNWDPDSDMVGCLGNLWVDFGSGRGLWNNDGASWSRLSNWDVDSAGLACWSGGLAADFDGNGLWNYDESAWRKLSNWDPEDDLAGWPGGLAVDFGGNGLWNNDGSSWTRLSNWDPEGMTGVTDGLVVDFDGNGVWKYDSSSWSKLSNWNAENMADCDLN